jgi:hypothetical protein
MALLVDFTGGSATQSGCTAPDNQEFTVGTGKPYDGLGKVYVAKRRLDTAETGGTNTSTDVYRMISVPAGTLCLGAWIITVEAETSADTATIALGDGDGTAGYLTATAPSTTVGGVIAELYNGTGAYRALAGRFYKSADTIDVLVGTAAFTDGVYDVCALLVDLN